MRTIMTLNALTTPAQLEQFLDGAQVCSYEVLSSKDERYQWVQKTLVQFRYTQLSKPEKGIVTRYLCQISGYSQPQIKRLIRQYRQTGHCTRKQRTSNGFSRRYTDADIRLLAEMDELHETPCGAVVKKLCARALIQGDRRYERLALISASHIYNLRHSKPYQQRRRHFEKTRAKASSIGERRKPSPEGQPGYLRVDTVHQGDQDKRKGVYHINLVDEVTQFEITFATERISERYLEPGLEGAMARLPFKIRGFHSDNGSEFINKTVSQLLQKLHVEFTKSRSRHSNDNALAESKNASVIRKHFGYEHIPQHWASEINEALSEPLYRYQNFHRPCFFPSTIIDDKGKQRKTYPYKNLMTPIEKLLSIDNVEQHLKEGVTILVLQQYAQAKTDTEAAHELKQAKRNLFERIFQKKA
jgi:transposase InsO family protein